MKKTQPANRSRWFGLLVCVALFIIPYDLTIGQDSDSNTDPPRDSIRAMSFNIRQGVAKDGRNHWNNRKDLVIQTIKNYDADVIGTQETWEFQAKFLAENLPGFTYVGRSRQNSDTGEQCGILFRTSRFDKLIEGYFWLSGTPDRPGSKSWDSSLPRMATWLKLWDRRTKRSFYIVNTHFDHRGKVARVQSAKLIREFVSSLPESSDVIVTGDFNAAPGSDPYQSLFGAVKKPNLDKTESPVYDTFRATHPNPTKTEGTFSAFNGAINGPRIDWIAVTRSFHVVSATIDRTSFENRYPSDHYPVTAELKFGEK